ncbi:metallopeptidase TldD-related protein [Microlunatus flavus]|uniref:Predicted Zn-dependent protease or its inactivated homolog n=1 Tax=Microlunatus flavus TaxID=1036181 RepID=A0A1H9MSU0_9ACTN|nr:metallopeptidase TldD-related protein [Microlunatus flavus]SER26671.1 Predicted Zn-dependent protease or its inactivated homolog [Microlunatus flavus]
MSVVDLLDEALRVATGPVVAVLTERHEVNLRWAANALTTNGEMRSVSLAVTATAEVEGGTAIATVAADLVEVSEVAAVVAAAEAAARAASPAEEPSPLVAAEAHPEDGDVRAGPATTTVETLADVAAGLGRAFERAAAEGHLLYGFAEHIVSTVYLASSTGLRRRGVDPQGRLELNGKSDDLARSAWVGQQTRTFADVDVDALYAEVSRRLGWARRTVELPPGRYETLLPPGPVADLVIYAAWTANARDAEDGSNVFAGGEGRTRVGERLAELPVDLLWDPAWPGEETLPFVASTSSPDGTSFAFDLGLPVEPVRWVEGGVLTQLVRNRAHAAATGQRPTPPADNFVMDAGGTATLDEMIARTKRGLLVTCFWYIREVDPERLLLTGLTRDGVYLVEDGEVVAAVNNFRWNESPIELLGRATEIGASVPVLCREWNDYVTRTVMPPLRIPDFNYSTVSQAS